MRLKPGVKLAGLTPQMCIAAMVAEGIYQKLGAEVVITSANDSEHSAASLHYKGLAIDIRTKTLTPATARKALAALKQNLTSEFDVVLESDHIHIEWDVRTPPEQVIS